MAKRHFLDKNEFFDMGENDMAFVWNSNVEVLLQIHPFSDAPYIDAPYIVHIKVCVCDSVNVT